MQPFRKVAFYTLGCKLNFSETSTIARLFEGHGFAKVAFEHAADVYVINTCSVTDNADKKCRAIVRKALRYNPEAFVVVVGCYAQLKPQEIAEISGVDLVLGAQEKFNILDHLDSLEKKEQGVAIAEHIKEVKTFVPGYSRGDRTRSFLKVQDGCDYFCAFCTIPLARGRSRSASVEETLATARELAGTEVREIVLTGVNIGDFGAGTDETFLDLVEGLEKIEGLERFRISSIEPNLLSDEVIERVAASKKFVPHFHIPLQSGSDNMLALMRRRYRQELYTNRVNKILSLMPDACIGVDVIVGFRGETDEEFQVTYDYLNQLPISYLHVFTYSERPNTTALRIDDIVPPQKRQERSKMLHILSAKKKRAFYEQQVRKEGTVLFEGENHDGMIHGFTENYIKVSLPYSDDLVNQLVPVKHLEIGRDGLMRSEVVEVPVLQ